MMIVEQMSCHGREMTVKQVAAKIASLRTYYGWELKKITQSEKSGAGVDDVYHSLWEFFAVLDPFLRCHVQQRPSTNNLGALSAPWIPLKRTAVKKHLTAVVTQNVYLFKKQTRLNHIPKRGGIKLQEVQN
ncbi:uncharacterized protein [Haliotis asinina]|uniref:uncharacterized protein n=1 Tax=Haliotis asinina TaxID=109174 RepID=UPI003532542A